MYKTFTITALFSILSIATLNSTTTAQVISFGPNGAVVMPGSSGSNGYIHQQHVHQMPQQQMTVPPQWSTQQVNHHHHHNHWPVQPAYPTYPIGPRPSNPVYVTPNEVVGYNPQTGGYDTQNLQINDTAFDYGRNESRNNGSLQWVRRPVYDQSGRVVGYQEGEVWNNSFTGQEHANLKNMTPNNQGGIHKNTVVRALRHAEGR